MGVAGMGLESKQMMQPLARLKIESAEKALFMSVSLPTRNALAGIDCCVYLVVFVCLDQSLVA